MAKADRPHHQRGDARTVESPRPELNVLGLVNGVKYSFLPSAKARGVESIGWWMGRARDGV